MSNRILTIGAWEAEEAAEDQAREDVHMLLTSFDDAVLESPSGSSAWREAWWSYVDDE